ncbi:MAG: type II toxin-antitoxin system VapC family toxin [Thermodesulfobacteriota bacterium]
MKYLLDTNVISESIKTSPDKRVLQLLETHQHDIAIAAPVWHELKFGCERLPASRKKAFIERFLNDVIKPNLPILPYDGKAAEWHAAERAKLTAQGLTPSFIDGQIAAISITNALVLVTRNIQDFAAFRDVVMENWYS